MLTVKFGGRQFFCIGFRQKQVRGADPDMTYIWSVPSNYPEKLVGLYDHDKSPDYLTLRRGERQPEDLARSIFRFDEAKLSRLRKLGALYNGSLLPLVNQALADEMTSIQASDVQVLSATVITKDGITNEFKLINPVRLVQCIDQDDSIRQYLFSSSIPIGFSRLRHVSGCMAEHHFARDKEYHGHFVVSDYAAERLMALRYPGLRLVRSEHYYNGHKANE